MAMDLLSGDSLFQKQTVHHRGMNYTLRLAEEADIPQLRLLLNNSYKELADMGLNYTATYQDEQTTRERMQQGKAFVLEQENKIIATILYYVGNHFTQKRSAYIGQFAVTPELKKSGLGTILMDHCEKLAAIEKFEAVQLDTAIPAEHLVNWYQKRGYQVVGRMRWDAKTYESYILEKPL